MNRAEIGAKGEAVAARYYQKQGYLLLGHNYRTRLGELDLILYKDDLLVFCEVKTRSVGSRISGAEAVDIHKQRRLIAAAQQYIQHSPYGECTVRFDVAEVTPTPQGWQVHCIMDAFQC